MNRITDDDLMSLLGRTQSVVSSRELLEVIGVLSTSAEVLDRFNEKGLAEMARASIKKLASGFPGHEEELLFAVEHVTRVDMARAIAENLKKPS